MLEYGSIWVLLMHLWDNITKLLDSILMLYHSDLKPNTSGLIYILALCPYVLFLFILERYDLINRISSQDVSLFVKDFDILDLGQLPEPDIPYKITTEKHILNKLSEDWLN
jgi:hypothetical protein